MTKPEETEAFTPDVGIAAARQALRRERLSLRERLGADHHAQLSSRICAHLRTLLESQPSRTLGFCLPFRAEVDVQPLVLSLLQRQWALSIPVVVQRGHAMEFRAWDSMAPCGRDPHGLRIPLTPPTAPPAILLLPVVAVDDAGYRLGYGGGYFDRTLAALAEHAQIPLCVGIGFALARVNDIQPQAHDQPLDLFVCEDGVTRFRS